MAQLSNGSNSAKRNKRFLYPMTGLAVVLCLSACGGDRVTAESVYNKCNQDNKLELSSDKKAIDLDYEYQQEPYDTIFKCLLKETSAPSSIDYRVGHGKQSDPTQSESWDGWEMLWTNAAPFPNLDVHLGEK